MNFFSKSSMIGVIFQHDGGAGTPQAKKPRARPKVQENMDIPLLAANSQVGLMNTVY